jgi:hypothetical protein
MSFMTSAKTKRTEYVTIALRALEAQSACRGEQTRIKKV